jgi:hypothetical protein
MTLLSSRLDELLGLLGILLLVRQIGNERVCAFQGEEQCGRTTDARVSTGNNGLLPLQLSGRLVLLKPVLVIGQLIIDSLDRQLVFLSRK